MPIPDDDIHALMPLVKEMVRRNFVVPDIPLDLRLILLADTSLTVGIELALRHPEWAKTFSVNMERYRPKGHRGSAGIADEYVRSHPISDHNEGVENANSI